MSLTHDRLLIGLTSLDQHRMHKHTSLYHYIFSLQGIFYIIGLSITRTYYCYTKYLVLVYTKKDIRLSYVILIKQINIPNRFIGIVYVISKSSQQENPVSAFNICTEDISNYFRAIFDINVAIKCHLRNAHTYPVRFDTFILNGRDYEKQK